MSTEMLPISSKKRVPPFASSNLPTLWVLAPVKAPFTCPKSSDSKRVGTRVPQSTATKGPLARGLSSWILRARSPLPVPDSPVMSTVESVGATILAISRTRFMAWLSPMMVVCPSFSARARRR